MSCLCFSVGQTDACKHCSALLSSKGVPFTDHPSPDVTHLLLDVPSFSAPGLLRFGMPAQAVLQSLPDSVTVIGGNLSDHSLYDFHCVDLLNDDGYLCSNAMITAHCALSLCASSLPVTFSDCRILILGWGRIGKCLCQLLKGSGASPTVCARSSKDRAMANALGYSSVSPEALPELLPDSDLILNTVPAAVLDKHLCNLCPNAMKMDLASTSGILSDDTIQARGLPGKYAPKSSGILMADTILRLCPEVLE